MKKIFIIILLLLIRWDKSFEPKIQDEDIEISELVNKSEDNLESESSSSSRSISSRPPSRFTPKQMAEAYGEIKNIKSQSSRSPANSPTKTSFSECITPTADFVPKFNFSTKTFAFDNLDKLVNKLKKADYPKFIYPVQHVFKGSGGGGKHFIDAKNLKDEAVIADPDLPFVQNNESKQLMGMIYLNSDKTKIKFSSIFPLGSSTEEIHDQLLMLDLKKPYAVGKIFFKGNEKSTLTMKFNGYFIIIDLDNFKSESLEDLLVANSIYPLFNLTKIGIEDLSKSDQPISLVNYRILQENGQWSANITAQISATDLNNLLSHALSNQENFTRYAIGCSNDNILISIPYDFAINKVNLEFDNHAKNITKNMYKITIEIPKSVADRINSQSSNYCNLLTSK